MMRTGRLLLLAMVASVAVAACTNPNGPTVQADEVALPTPIQSLDASAASTVGLLRGALGAIGERIDLAGRPVRPSEPQALVQVPRAALRAELADPDDGFVMVYRFPDGPAADVGAADLARYLASGFGQTNFSVDTQFSVATVDDSVIFTWWSRRRSSDAERAEAVFDAVSGVGVPIEVLK